MSQDVRADRQVLTRNDKYAFLLQDKKVEKKLFHTQFVNDGEHKMLFKELQIIIWNMVLFHT